MQIANNQTRAAALQRTVLQLGLGLALLCVLVLVTLSLVLGISWWIGLVLGVTVAGLAISAMVLRSSTLVVKSLGLKDLEECQNDRLVNLVEGLSLSTGTEEPRLYVVQDAARNALPLVVGDEASIIVTSGLIEDLGRMELEAVVAELLVRIKSGDAAIDTKVAGLFAYPMLEGPASGVLAPIGKWAMRKAIEPDAQITADQSAVLVTRYPPGLSSALDKISESYKPAKATAGNDHLWIAAPLCSDDVVPHTPLQWRIDILLEF